MKKMIENLVTFARSNLAQKSQTLTKIEKLAEVLTCHHLLYALMAALNAGLVLHLLDKSLYAQFALYVYFVLAIRP